jgi:hypothetical protein
MAQEPKRPVDEKVGAYAKPERRGGSGTIVAIILVIAVVLLLLWAFTDII